MQTVLLVEDDALLREAARQVLTGEGYNVAPVENGAKALDVLKTLTPDLIVSDIVMPELDGFGLLDAVRATNTAISIPFLFMSVNTDRGNIHLARRHGADDFLFKPFEMTELVEAVRVRLDRRRQVLLFDTREAHLQTVHMLANAIEARDIYTRGHVDRVREHALALGGALCWSLEQLAELEFGALLHDVGKVLVPEHVLNKRGALSPDEQSLVRRHVEAGAQMLSGVKHLQAVIPYILYHHERWDGSGYPHGLAGEAIPIQGRLLAIVDAFDAMTTERPYHKAMSKDTALDEIGRRRGISFDPLVTDAFLELTTSGP